MTGKKPIVAVVGTGLIGCSLALALKDSQYCDSILGSSRTTETLEHARRSGAVDIKLISARDAAAADVIILSAPVAAVVSHLHELGKAEVRCRLIIDAGSIKLPVIQAAVKSGLGSVFVGGHPMAGGEKSGPKFACTELFKDKTFFLVPTSETSPETLQVARELVKAVGAIAQEIEAQEHDTTVALTSHLPYLLACALTRLADEQSDKMSYVVEAIAGGFKDLTRLADGSPEMWSDILADNAALIREWLENLQAIAGEILDAADDSTELMKTLKRLREEHRKLTD